MGLSRDSPSPPQAPQTPLERSPSTPNFSSLHPLNPAPTTTSPSTPDLRQGLPEGKIAKIQSFFRRKPSQPSPQPHMAFDLRPLASLAERDETASLTDMQDNISQASTEVASVPSPLDNCDSDIGSTAELSTEHHEHDADQTQSPDTPSADLSQHKIVNSAMALERAKLVALADDNEVHDEHVVRKYRISGAGKYGCDGDSTAKDPVGLWRCCKCAKGQDVYLYDHGPHLVSVVNCDCPHRSCEDCTLIGGIKAYKPVYEPFPIQLNDKDKRVLFGIFCGDCGSSWQARITGYMQDTVRQKISAVPKNLAKHGAHPLAKLRSSRSMNNLLGQPSPKAPALKANKSTLNLRALSNEMEKEYGKQASSVMVKFSGITCTCGCILDTSALCFQIVDQPKKKVVEPPIAVGKQAAFTATPEDKARGIETRTITLRYGGNRIRHANPLRSAPVTEDELARLYGD